MPAKFLAILKITRQAEAFHCANIGLAKPKKSELQLLVASLTLKCWSRWKWKVMMFCKFAGKPDDASSCLKLPQRVLTLNSAVRVHPYMSVY